MTNQRYNRLEIIQRSVDEILTREGEPPLAKEYPEVEDILECCRPTEALPRTKSINMRLDRDFGRMGLGKVEWGYIHVVEPLTSVQERDVAWLGALQVRYPKQGHQITDKLTYPELRDDQLADRYWKGIRSESPSIEYVTKEARVLSVEQNLSPVNPHGMATAYNLVQGNAVKIAVTSSETEVDFR